MPALVPYFFWENFHNSMLVQGYWITQFICLASQYEKVNGPDDHL